jgi:ADP-ribose pyrophosphatase
MAARKARVRFGFGGLASRKSWHFSGRSARASGRAFTHVFTSSMGRNMVDGWPKLTRSKLIPVSPWLDVIARDVQFFPESAVETYYAISQPTYLVALAVTPEGRILLVRQYRPAVERFSLELPAGMLEGNEEPAEAITRELLEETGYSCRSITPIGETVTCASRIDNSMHSFFIETGERVRDFVEEPGVSVSSALPVELRALILSGEFAEQTHLGVLTLAVCKGLITL